MSRELTKQKTEIKPLKTLSISVTDLKQALETASKNIDIERKNEDLDKSATDRFLNDIKGYVNHPKYNHIKEYLKIITNSESKIKCLILEGESGCGKSTICKSILKELGKDIYYINSYSTSLSFYKALYLNRFKSIIIDDTFGIFNDEKGIAILRAVTNTEKERYVKYESTSDKLDVPSSFIFEGNLTILTNHITSQMSESLLSRAIYRKIYFTLQEKFDFMEKVANFNYPNLDLKEVMEFIKSEVDETTRNFSFRSVIKIIEYYKFNKKSWKDMAYEELEKDEDLVLIKELQGKFLEVKEQADEFIKLTGKSRRTFFRIKKRVSKCHTDKNELKGGKMENGKDKRTDKGTTKQSNLIEIC